MTFDLGAAKQIKEIEALVHKLFQVERQVNQISDEINCRFNDFVLQVEGSEFLEAVIRAKAFKLLREDSEANALQVERAKLEECLAGIRGELERRRWELATYILSVVAGSEFLAEQVVSVMTKAH
jgi:hypothetical protein